LSSIRGRGPRRYPIYVHTVSATKCDIIGHQAEAKVCTGIDRQSIRNHCVGVVLLLSRKIRSNECPSIDFITNEIFQLTKSALFHT